MKVVLIGASGRAGSRILTELLDRGHTVTAVARHPEKLASHSEITAVEGDINDTDALAAHIAGHEAVISAVRFASFEPRSLINAAKQAGVQRLLVVGGAGSLKVADGTDLVDTAAFPAEVKPEAVAGRAFLEILRSEKTLGWTFLSPSAVFAPGQRTGSFRLGTDQLLVDANGESKISMEDFAIAMVDELENSRHSGSRFTVGY